MCHFGVIGLYDERQRNIENSLDTPSRLAHTPKRPISYIMSTTTKMRRAEIGYGSTNRNRGNRKKVPLRSGNGCFYLFPAGTYKFSNQCSKRMQLRSSDWLRGGSDHPPVKTLPCPVWLSVARRRSHRGPGAHFSSAGQIADGVPGRIHIDVRR